MGLASKKAVKHPIIPFPCMCTVVSHPVSARQLMGGYAFLDLVCHIGFSIILQLCSPVPMITELSSCQVLVPCEEPGAGHKYPMSIIRGHHVY